MIVENHDDVRQGLAFMLSAVDDLVLVGQVANVAEAVDLCKQLQPDVVLLSLPLREMDSIEAIELIRQTCPDTQIIALLTIDSEKTLAEATLKAGADSYLYKHASADGIKQAIRATNADR